MTALRMTWRILFALMIGCIATIWYVQNDTRFHEHVARIIRNEFSTVFDCVACGSIISINIFNPEIVVENPRVSAHDGTWRWSARKVIYRFSWFDVLRFREIPGRVLVQHYGAYSEILNGRISLLDHIERMASSIEGLPITLKHVVITQGKLHCAQRYSGVEWLTDIAFEVRAFDDRWRTTVYLNNGVVKSASELLCSRIGLQVHGEISKSSLMQSWGTINGSIDLEYLKDKQAFIKGTWRGSEGDIELYTKDGTLKFDEFHLQALPNFEDIYFTLRAHAPLAYFARFVQSSSPDITLKGTCSIDASGKLFDQQDGIATHIAISDVGYQKYNVGNLELSSVRKDGVWKGDCSVHRDGISYARGSWLVQEIDGSGFLDIHTDVSIPAWPTRYWRIEPQDCNIQGMWHPDGTVYATFNCKATHAKLGTQSTVSGGCAYKDRKITVQGIHDQTSYMAEGFLFPYVRLKRFRYRDSHGQQVITLTADQTLRNLDMSIDYPFFKAIFDDYVGYRVPGKGKLKAHGTINSLGFDGNLWLEDSQIRLHDTFNFIREGHCSFSIDTEQNKCVLKDCNFVLQQGALRCSRATCFWDSSGVRFLHAPLIMDTIFLNVEKDFFGQLSGSTCMQIKDDESTLYARIILDKGQLKRNIFSSIVHQSMTRQLLPSAESDDSNELVYDATIKTKQPLHVKTSFLQTDAHIDLAVQGTLDEPNITGSIKLLHGSLQFPYKPLYIHQGLIYFAPGHANDPMIELNARGRIKKYSIVMNVSGSVQNPYISFESTPPLSEEQIVTLLLAGSEEGSLRVVMPSLIMKNVQGLLFSSEHTPSKMQTYLNNILVPLRHVRLVPSFSDQTARGGFRWALEIDVSDRFHGVIQKNFSLSEDTRIEAEYVLSDDISVRGVKDERGDMGGEVEMRWKF